jgi:hypothetical protein
MNFFFSIVSFMYFEFSKVFAQTIKKKMQGLDQEPYVLGGI